MRARVVISVAVFSGRLFGAEQINVALCNLGGLPDSIVQQAKAETQAVFYSSRITLKWTDCGQGKGPGWFTIRLRGDAPPHTAGASSLDAMGRAFLDNHGSGYLADAYIRAVRELANQQGSDPAALLGVVMAHELGHLLLGPGHTASGVMRSTWSSRELRALNHRWLTFSPDQRAKMEVILSGTVGDSR